jgi:hypothetical protein
MHVLQVLHILYRIADAIFWMVMGASLFGFISMMRLSSEMSRDEDSVQPLVPLGRHRGFAGNAHDRRLARRQQQRAAMLPNA